MKRRNVKTKKRAQRVAPQRLVEGDDFRINKRAGNRIDISPAGMTRIVEEWLKGRPTVLVVEGRDAVKIVCAKPK